MTLVDQTTWLTGTPGNDTAQGIAIDVAGNVFVVGSTNGVFKDNTNAGGYDSVVIKFLSSSGTVAWARQIGSTKVVDGSVIDVDVDGNAIVLDNKGSALVTGTTNGDIFDGISNSGFGFDAFLMSYDTNGVKQ